MSTDQGPHTAFFYGTLMSPAVLHRVIHGTTTPSALQRHVSPLRTYPALLPHHVRHRVRGCDYPAVLPAQESTSTSTSAPAATNPTATTAAPSVRGTLVTGLSAADLWRLDRFEGDEYQRRRVAVTVLGPGAPTTSEEKEEEDPAAPSNIALQQHSPGATVPAETYIWIAGADRLEPREWDFAEFVRDKLARWTGEAGEGEYADVDDAVAAAAAAAATQGDAMGGRNWNGALGKAIDGSRSAENQVLRDAV